MKKVATDAALLSVFRDLETSAGTALVRFQDGDAYVVRAISTLHAEDGDDIVAEVLHVVSAMNGISIPVGSFMNFLLGDVAEVIVDGASVFTRTPDDEPGAANNDPSRTRR